MRISWILLVSMMMCACSSASIKRIDAGNTTEEGLRFYRPVPHLLVTLTEVGDSTAKLKSEIIWLPDYSEVYAIKPTRWVGKSDMTVTLTDGWALKSLTLNRDGKTSDTIKETVGGIASLAGLATMLKNRDKELIPGLYRIDYNDKNGSKVVALTRLKIEVE